MTNIITFIGLWIISGNLISAVIYYLIIIFCLSFFKSVQQLGFINAFLVLISLSWLLDDNE